MVGEYRSDGPPMFMLEMPFLRQVAVNVKMARAKRSLRGQADSAAQISRREFYAALALVWTFIMLAFATIVFGSFRAPTTLIYLAGCLFHGDWLFGRLVARRVVAEKRRRRGGCGHGRPGGWRGRFSVRRHFSLMLNPNGLPDLETFTAAERSMEYPTFYRTTQMDGLSIFYREAGPKEAPTLLLLHGLPSSSRMFEPLFARLSDRYHLVAPDYPGFGHSDWPDPRTIRLHVRSLRRDHESLDRGARDPAVHALHAGLRRPRGFSHGPGAPEPDRGAHRPGRGRAQRRPGGELEAAARLLGRSRRQRRHASHESPVAGDDADAPCRERSRRRAL